jgi:O-succinylhomoserine sulfhydrylase
MSDAKKPLPAGLRPETLAVRAGTDRSHHGEHSEAMFLTSSFVFPNAFEAAERFQGRTPGNVFCKPRLTAAPACTAVSEPLYLSIAISTRISTV